MCRLTRLRKSTRSAAIAFGYFALLPLGSPVHWIDRSRGIGGGALVAFYAVSGYDGMAGNYSRSRRYLLCDVRIAVGLACSDCALGHELVITSVSFLRAHICITQLERSLLVRADHGCTRLRGTSPGGCEIRPERNENQLVDHCAQPMLVYSTWFAYRYSVATPFATNWTEHVSSGGVLSNLHAQSKNVFRGALIGYVASLSLLLACVVTLWSRGAAPIERVRALWLATLLILTYLPAAQARNAATYYMLPVLASALLAMAWWASLVLHGANRRVGARVHFAIVAIATISGLFAAHLRSSAFQMRDRSEQSRAFITTHVTPDVVRDVLQSGKLCFEVDPRDPRPVLFVDSPRAYALLRWVAQPQNYAQLREIPVLVNYPGRGTQFSAADCTARFVKHR